MLILTSSDANIAHVNKTHNRHFIHRHEHLNFDYKPPTISFYVFCSWFTFQVGGLLLQSLATCNTRERRIISHQCKMFCKRYSNGELPFRYLQWLTFSVALPRISGTPFVSSYTQITSVHFYHFFCWNSLQDH